MGRWVTHDSETIYETRLGVGTEAEIFGRDNYEVTGISVDISSGGPSPRGIPNGAKYRAVFDGELEHNNKTYRFRNYVSSWTLVRGSGVNMAIDIFFRASERAAIFVSGTLTLEYYIEEPALTPTSITVPTIIKGGESFTVSWGTSSRATRYHLERQINGGSWSQVYQGNERTYTDTAQYNWNTVRYRVRGYNSDGYSSYRTSPTRDVSHNSPPTKPPSIAVPKLKSGKTATITWGKSTDPDGDALTYRLERQANEGNWVNVYSGSSNSYSDAILKDWDTVRYRVRAYDGEEFSEYITSATELVVHFPELKMKINGAIRISENGWVKINGNMREIDSVSIKVNGKLKEV